MKTPARSSVTLKDVARLAGVSSYSASRAINGQSGVSEATRERIETAAQRLGYVPNRLASSLRRQESKTIGVLTSNAANTFYATLVDGIESVVGQDDFHVITSDATDAGRYSSVKEEAFLRSLMELRVAGVVLTYQPRIAQMQRLVDWGVPVVFVDCAPPDEYSFYPFIMNGGEGAAEDVGRHFAEHGYDRWALVGHPSDWPTRIARQAGFLRAAEQAGAHVDVIEGGRNAAEALEAVSAYLNSGRSARAILATNEPLLNGALRALGAQGLRVPEDVAVVGFDDFPWADLHTPAISTVDQHVRAMGEMAGARVLGAIAGLTLASPDDLTPPAPMIRIRESCGTHPATVQGPTAY